METPAPQNRPLRQFFRRLQPTRPALRVFDPAAESPRPISDRELATKRFFCVRGAMKSGTNWVSNLLNLHPDVSCVGEFHWQHILQAVNETVDRLEWLRHDEEVRRGFRREFELLIKRVMLGKAGRQADWVGDRTPARLHPVALPDAPHIRIVRDGRDVLISRVFHNLNRVQNPLIRKEVEKDEVLRGLHQKYENNREYFNEHPEELLSSERVVRRYARDWRVNNACDRTTMENQPWLDVLVIAYEELHADTERIRDQMLSFIGADPEKAGPLDPITTPGFIQQGIEDHPEKSFYRKGRIGDWQNYMTDQARQWFNEEAGDELIRLGYAKDYDW